MNMSLQTKEEKKKLMDGVFSLRSCLLDLERSLPLLEVVNPVLYCICFDHPNREMVMLST